MLYRGGVFLLAMPFQQQQRWEYDGNYFPFAKRSLYPVLHRHSHPEVTAFYLRDEVLIVFGEFFPP